MQAFTNPIGAEARQSGRASAVFNGLLNPPLRPGYRLGLEATQLEGPKHYAENARLLTPSGNNLQGVVSNWLSHHA